MYPEYPNLPLLENKFLMYLKLNDKEVEKDGYKKHNFECLGVFLQYWPNTAGLAEDGGFSGQAISTYYTTVFAEHESHNAAIFQNNDLIYVLSEMNENFMDDLEHHDIKPLKFARMRYTNELCDE